MPAAITPLTNCRRLVAGLTNESVVAVGLQFEFAALLQASSGITRLMVSLQDEIQLRDSQQLQGIAAGDHLLLSRVEARDGVTRAATPVWSERVDERTLVGQLRIDPRLVLPQGWRRSVLCCQSERWADEMITKVDDVQRWHGQSLGPRFTGLHERCKRCDTYIQCAKQFAGPIDEPSLVAMARSSPAQGGLRLAFYLASWCHPRSFRASRRCFQQSSSGPIN